MRRRLMTGCGLLALSLLAGAAWFTHHTNQRDREREELILRLQTSKVARHVNADKPQYEPYFHRFLNSERSLMKVLLYDLSGWEIGRARYTQPPVRLNETAARYAVTNQLRPLNGETPLAPYPKTPPGLSAEKRLGNRLFATNVLEGTWITEMRATTGERWLVATAPVFQFDAKIGRSFVSAWVQAAVPMVEFERPARERWQLFALGA